jgi:hypothetical protein
MSDGPTVLLEDNDGEVQELPLTRECCGEQSVIAEETPHGLVDKCDNCGEYV